MIVNEEKKAVSYLFELKLIAVPVLVDWWYQHRYGQRSEGWFFFEINEVNDLFFLSHSERFDIMDCDH